jgi:hypothetical protein
MKYHVHKAQRSGFVRVQDCEIFIGPMEPPEIKNDNWEAILKDVYGMDAALLFDALSSLPGGTWDRLLCLMLEKKASLLKVPLWEEKTHYSEQFRHTTILPARNILAVLNGEVQPPPDSVTGHNTDFPLVIQTVMFAAGQKTGINFNDTDTATLASEIRKLVDMRSIRAHIVKFDRKDPVWRTFKGCFWHMDYCSCGRIFMIPLTRRWQLYVWVGKMPTIWVIS